VVGRAGAGDLSLEAVTAYLAQREVSKELWPEYLVTVDDLPRSSGGKIAKSELRDDAKRRFGS
jgi:acyl-CoA synthetase